MNSKVAQRIIQNVRSDKVRRAAHRTCYFRLHKHVPNSIGMRHLNFKPNVIYLSKVLTERFSILYKTQTKEDIRFYILTLVEVDKYFTFSVIV